MELIARVSIAQTIILLDIVSAELFSRSLRSNVFVRYSENYFFDVPDHEKDCSIYGLDEEIFLSNRHMLEIMPGIDW